MSQGRNTESEAIAFPWSWNVTAVLVILDNCKFFFSSEYAVHNIVPDFGQVIVIFLSSEVSEKREQWFDGATVTNHVLWNFTALYRFKALLLHNLLHFLAICRVDLLVNL
jgi:hypothetical protein